MYDVLSGTTGWDFFVGSDTVPSFVTQFIDSLMTTLMKGEGETGMNNG